MGSELLQALRDSEAKYVRVIKLFKEEEPKNQAKWFTRYCDSGTCALCNHFLWICGSRRPVRCPLNDEGFVCCKEWHRSSDAADNSKLTPAHLEAILERIRREIRKLEGEA